MALKIHLDAGHYGKYNQSPCNKNYWESVQMWKLQNLLKAYLEAYGVKVSLTRSDQSKDMEVYDRGKTAKGTDLFISLHSNAVGSKANESVDYVRVYVPLNKKADDIGYKLAKTVADVMGTKQKAHIETREGSNGDYYGVIRGAVAVGVPGIIIEHSFHTNSRSTEFLLSDVNLNKIAKAEAETIVKHFGITTPISNTDYEAIGKAVLQVVSDINSLDSVKALKKLIG